MRRTFLSGADLVLADRLAGRRTIVIESDRIVDVVDGGVSGGAGDLTIDLTGRFVTPGFIDLHLHGAAGHDVLDGAGAVRAIADWLPRTGVTAFCPTSLACAPEPLGVMLAEVASLREVAPGGGATADGPAHARVFGAHLETNFINPDFRGAQPLDALRVPGAPRPANGAFSASDILDVIAQHRDAVAMLTLAPEIDGGLDLVRTFVAGGHRVSLGHSGATFEEAQEAFGAGARRATHLFNRMSLVAPRAPGLAGAVLAAEDVYAEIIADGYHVHPSLLRMAIAAKGTARIMAVTDGTAGLGLRAGEATQLGHRRVRVGHTATLDDGTIAGGVTAMDRVLRRLVDAARVSIVGAVEMCTRTPARSLGLDDCGFIAAGAVADLVVLDPRLEVQSTWIGGQLVYETDD